MRKRGQRQPAAKRENSFRRFTIQHGRLRGKLPRRRSWACAPQSTVFSIEPRDFTRRLAIDSALLQISPLITGDFALPDAELGFYFSIFPVELENDKRPAFHLCFAIELIDLLPMQQQFADAFCGRDLVAGAFVGLNVSVVKESFAVFDSRESVADVCFASADGFDFTAFQFDARFVAVQNAIVAKRFAIGDRFARHIAYGPQLAKRELPRRTVLGIKRRPRNPRATR